jgi:hypothetical protein
MERYTTNAPIAVIYTLVHYRKQIYIVACRAVARQQLSKHVPAAMDMHATIDILLETVFYTQSMQRGYKVDN